MPAGLVFFSKASEKLHARRKKKLVQAPTSSEASSRAATPGKSLPSSNSREAPPPVLQCDTLSTVLYFLQAVAVSPPPITEIAPAAVTSTILSIIPLVHSRQLSWILQLQHHSSQLIWDQCPVQGNPQ